MSDRKYRQHGYQDDDRSGDQRSGRGGPKAKEPFDPRIPRDPRVPNMPGFRQVFKCARCGSIQDTGVASRSTCTQCGVPLHACIHCDGFDPGSRFECRQTIPERVSPKDEANDCGLFAPRVQVERETHSTRVETGKGASGAKKAFDDLFKF